MLTSACLSGCLSDEGTLNGTTAGTGTGAGATGAAATVVDGAAAFTRASGLLTATANLFGVGAAAEGEDKSDGATDGESGNEDCAGGRVCVAEGVGRGVRGEAGGDAEGGVKGGDKGGDDGGDNGGSVDGDDVDDGSAFATSIGCVALGCAVPAVIALGRICDGATAAARRTTCSSGTWSDRSSQGNPKPARPRLWLPNVRLNNRACSRSENKTASRKLRRSRVLARHRSARPAMRLGDVTRAGVRADAPDQIAKGARVEV